MVVTTNENKEGVTYSINYQKKDDDMKSEESYDSEIDQEAAMEEFLEERRLIEKSERGRRYFNQLNAFFEKLGKNEIIGKHDWTCCNTCGAADMWKEYSDEYEGYVFYHGQDYDMVIEDIQNNAVNVIKVYLSWNLFTDYTPSEEEYKVFAAKIKSIGNELDLNIEGDDSRVRLKMSVNMID